MSEWIDVKDRLPYENDHVLVHRNTKNPYLKIQIICWNHCDVNDFKVTHWMPLPTPPKEITK